jgi:hypothetical protein
MIEPKLQHVSKAAQLMLDTVAFDSFESEHEDMKT